MLSFPPWVSREITSKGILSVFSKGHESEFGGWGASVYDCNSQGWSCWAQHLDGEEKLDPEVCVGRSLVTQWALQFIVADDLIHLPLTGRAPRGPACSRYTTK